MKEYVHCDSRVVQEYEQLETRATYKFENKYFCDPYFYNLCTKQASVEEIQNIYLNIKILPVINRLKLLENDIIQI